MGPLQRTLQERSHVIAVVGEAIKSGSVASRTSFVITARRKDTWPESLQDTDTDTDISQTEWWQRQGAGQTESQMDRDSLNRESDTPPDSAVLTVTCTSSRPITVQMELNGQLVPMELDIGATVLLISHSTQQGVHASPSKVKAIMQAPSPKNVQELRSFLGMMNYYGKFLANLSTLLHPLNELLKTDVTWEWSEECERAFQEAKGQLSCALVLAHYDPSLPIRLAGDGLNYGVGAVLSLVTADGHEHPIAFAS